MVWRTRGGNPDPSSGIPGGLPVRRIDQRYTPLPPGAAPGPQSPVFIGKFVIVFGTQGGVFVYNGQPGPGNGPIFWVVSPTTTTDPYGNPVTPVLGAGTPGSPLFSIDQSGNVESTATDGSQVGISSQLQIPLVLTQALAGTILGALTFKSADANATNLGLVADVVLGTGTASKPGVLICSPYGSTGAGILIQSVDDAGTDLPWITFCTVAQQTGTTAVTPLAAFTSNALVLYSGGGTLTIITHTSGSGTIPIPAGVSTVLAECWGAGGGGGTAANFGAASAGGGEYAAEPALAVTVAGVAYVVGSAGTGGVIGGGASTNGGNSTLTGTSVTVTGHGGIKGTSTATPGAGGSGSTNTVNHPGGSGANGATGSSGGGGGGGSGGTGHAGNAGHAGIGPSGGSGGAAPAGGGVGGQGGNVFFPGQGGGAPGGGGGGGSAGNNGGNGASGQVRVTYTGTAPGILLSAAKAAITDQFGTAIPAGPQWGAGLAGFLTRAPAADFTSFTVTATAATQCTKAWSIPAADAQVGTKYRLTFEGTGTQGSTQEILNFNVSGFAQAAINQTFAGASQAFDWKVIAEVTVITTGSGGTANFSLLCSAGQGVNNGFSHAGAFNTTTPFTLEGEGFWTSATGAPTFTCLQSGLERIGP